MSDNKSAFHSSEYDKNIRQTIPYYQDFYEQIIDLVKAHNKMFHLTALKWLDVGCGTGKMASLAYECTEIEKFVFCDCSMEMLKTAKKRFPFSNAEFSLCDIQNLPYTNEFDIVTTILVNHYLQKEERKTAIKKCWKSLKTNGLFITFENFAPFGELGQDIYLDRWKSYQLNQGRGSTECEGHIKRYGKEYFPISVTEHLELIQNCGFRSVEILWLSNMQVGIWGIK